MRIRLRFYKVAKAKKRQAEQAAAAEERYRRRGCDMSGGGWVDGPIREGCGRR